MHFKSIVFGLIFLVYLSDCEALNAGDKGVCTVTQSIRNNVKKWFTVFKNPKCGRRCGIVRRSRVEPKVVNVNRSVCCSGWIYNANEDICEPVCSHGCVGGRCTAPETCAPYVCTAPCVNALCIENVCQCTNNFTRYNDTHCYSCDPGYVIDENFSCIPVCDKECVNSVCDQPNHCKCLDGYQSVNNFTCEPMCDSCVNSTCVAPNNCLCFDGFVRINETVCGPPCECQNGLCVEGNCGCNVGYISVGGVCQPHCEEECINGFCSGANVCSCLEGFERIEAKPNVCRRTCAEECNGTCDDNGECFASCQKPM